MCLALGMLHVNVSTEEFHMAMYPVNEHCRHVVRVGNLLSMLSFNMSGVV